MEQPRGSRRTSPTSSSLGRRGIKKQKYGEPDRNKLAKEVMDVLRVALQVVEFYGLEPELGQTIEASYAKAKLEGLTEGGE